MPKKHKSKLTSLEVAYSRVTVGKQNLDCAMLYAKSGNIEKEEEWVKEAIEWLDGAIQALKDRKAELKRISMRDRLNSRTKSLAREMRVKTL